MKNKLVIALLFFCSQTFFAQQIDFENLKNITFETPKDYEDFEKGIGLYVDWLQNNSLNHKERPRVNALMFRWIEGTPNVMIVLENSITRFSKKNPDFLILFMATWSRYILNHPEEKDDVLVGTFIGLNAVLDFYQKGKAFGVRKDKRLEKLLKKREQKVLDEYVIKKLKVKYPPADFS